MRYRLRTLRILELVTVVLIVVVVAWGVGSYGARHSARVRKAVERTRQQAMERYKAEKEAAEDRQ